MTGNGKFTAQVGEHLERLLKPRGYDVFFDHGVSRDEVGSVVVWFGPNAKLSRDNELCQIDIAVREQKSDRTIALIEVEETSDRPKTVLADVFAALCGDHVSFKGKDLCIGPWTTLVVLAIGPGSHGLRNEFIAEAAMLSRNSLQTANRLIGRILVESVLDQNALQPRVSEIVEHITRHV